MRVNVVFLEMDNKPPQNKLLRYAGLSTQWMALLSLAAWTGYKADRRIQWKVPVFVILLPLIALMISLWQLIKEVNQTNK